MALVAGSVTVQADESRTGDGLAVAIYDADRATVELPAVPTLGSTARPWRPEVPVSQADVDTIRAARVRVLRDIARRANAYASATVGYFKANAEVAPGTLVAHVTNQSLGTLPDPPTAGAAIVPTQIDVPLTGAGRIS